MALQINHVDVHIDDAILRSLIFRHLLSGISPGKLLDLGAGHCIYSIWAQQQGFEVTAVDARTQRLPPREKLGAIKFIQSDVRVFDVSGFDVILCIGLIYHLEIPDQLSLLERCAKTRAIVILETEVHIPEQVPSDFNEPWARQIVEREEYCGVVFPESGKVMSSIGNDYSFWHTEDSWLRMFQNAGFSEVTVVKPKYRVLHGARGFYVLK
jgi:predicted RNA methylase